MEKLELKRLRLLLKGMKLMTGSLAWEKNKKEMDKTFKEKV
tara:strand:+ start:193 stop:315 length:123 start_codon:yes stop_codon:yes gene_type:complete